MKYKIHTFGSQMNVYDTGRIERHLGAAGHTEVDTEEEADLVLLNTCSIRDSAESRVYGTIGRLAKFKREKPGRLVAIAGCMAQKEGERLLNGSRIVDVVAGTHAIPRIPKLLERAANGAGPQIDTVKSQEDLFDDPDLPPDGKEIHRYPVFVSIIQGCNKVCSFCVVPYTRGIEVCRPPEEVVHECAALVDRGYHEVTLIGQNVDSYRYEEVEFADLLMRVSRIEDLDRIRFTTSHPQDITPKLIDTVAGLPNVCESFHFPLQAGADRVLTAMKRGYTVEEYFEKLEYLENIFGSRDENPFAYNISTDLMVGFANETEEEFEQTLECVRRARWDSAFMFKYSKRERTAAYPWEDQVPDEVKSERLARLISLQEEVSLGLNRNAVGKEAEVLIEAVPGYDPEQDIDVVKGRTRTNKSVAIQPPMDKALPTVGRRVPARIVSCRPVTLTGELVQQAGSAKV
jgi:tRNA-2-methylthio-N6-dimethylallyladenosine synthase